MPSHCASRPFPKLPSSLLPDAHLPPAMYTHTRSKQRKCPHTCFHTNTQLSGGTSTRAGRQTARQTLVHLMSCFSCNDKNLWKFFKYVSKLALQVLVKLSLLSAFLQCLALAWSHLLVFHILLPYMQITSKQPVFFITKAPRNLKAKDSNILLVRGGWWGCGHSVCVCVCVCFISLQKREKRKHSHCCECGKKWTLVPFKNIKSICLNLTADELPPAVIKNKWRNKKWLCIKQSCKTKFSAYY